MNVMTEMIQEFHEKFGLTYLGPPRKLDDEERLFRGTFLLEEIGEYEKAPRLVDELDALVDLVYVAMGTAYRQGFDFDEAFRRVHAANMRKVRAKGSDESKRGNPLDVVRPEGWEPPFLEDLARNPNDH